MRPHKGHIADGVAMLVFVLPTVMLLDVTGPACATGETLERARMFVTFRMR
jgi:hypothetical protein